MLQSVIDIIYQDDDIVAVNKPAGMLVHRSELAPASDANIVDLLHMQLNRSVFPVHRLDRATSGLLLLATSSAVASRLGAAFARQQVRKNYWAVVRGWPESDCAGIDHQRDEQWQPFLWPGKSTTINAKVVAADTSWQLIDHPLAKPKSHETQRRFSKVSRNALTEKKPAKTFWRTLAYLNWEVEVDRYPSARYSVVELRPKSGRAHQLRRHMKHISHPMIGDVKYGKGTHNRFFKNDLGLGQLMLVANGLTLQHPVTGRCISFHSMPNDKPGTFFSSVIASAGLAHSNTLAA